MEHNKPTVGIGLLVFKDRKVLLGKCKGAHAANVYAGPGGHLEHKESFAGGAKMVLLGRVAYLAITRRKILNQKRIKYLFIVHPAAALRFPRIKTRFLKDFQKLERMLKYL